MTTVEEALVDAWEIAVRPHVKPAACILAGRLASEVFTYFGVKHRVLPIHATAMNDAAVAEIEAGRMSVEEWPDEAWSVGLGAKTEAEGPGWAGHLVVGTDDFFIDLTAQQMDRPKKSIEVGAPICTPGTSFEIFEAMGLPSLRLKQGLYVWKPEPENTSYRQARDWRRNYKPYAGPVIRYIRSRMESVVPEP